MTIPADSNDELIEVGMTDGTHAIILATRNGQAIHFPEEKVRPMGRTAFGVKGINLAEDDYVISMVVVKRMTTLLSVTENGYGKRSEISDYRITNRGGKGIINIKASERNGKVVAVREVVDPDELMIITHKGIIIRTSVKAINVIGRNTQGVRMIRLDEGDKVMDVARIIPEDKPAEGLPDDNGVAPIEGDLEDAEPDDIEEEDIDTEEEDTEDEE
jgi:DNA gyrase subunit A